MKSKKYFFILIMVVFLLFTLTYFENLKTKCEIEILKEKIENVQKMNEKNFKDFCKEKKFQFSKTYVL